MPFSFTLFPLFSFPLISTISLTFGSHQPLFFVCRKSSIITSENALEVISVWQLSKTLRVLLYSRESASSPARTAGPPQRVAEVAQSYASYLSPKVQSSGCSPLHSAAPESESQAVPAFRICIPNSEGACGTACTNAVFEYDSQLLEVSVVQSYFAKRKINK